MSRSYKKTPIIKDSSKTKRIDKRNANKSVRHNKDLSGKGNGYKKCFESYDINDYYYGSYSLSETVNDIVNCNYIKPKDYLREFHKRIGK